MSDFVIYFVILLHRQLDQVNLYVISPVSQI